MIQSGTMTVLLRPSVFASSFAKHKNRITAAKTYRGIEAASTSCFDTSGTSISLGMTPLYALVQELITL
jgi:hypothetical protein